MTPLPPPPPLLLAVAADVRHRVSSRLLDGFDDWWQMPAAVMALAAAAAYVVWMVRRDAVDQRWPVAGLLAGLRLAALAAIAAALLDIERIAEHEIALPSRVAVLVDASASMSLADADAAAATRAERAADLVEAGLLAAVLPRHEATVWRFDADAAAVLRLSAAGVAPDDGDAGEWRAQLAPGGAETRLGEAVARALETGPVGTLAGIVVLSDGGHNAGLDPGSAAAAAVRAGVAVHAIGVGSDVLPANVRVTDLVAPARVFPGDRFMVTAFLQLCGLAGERVRVELEERPGDEAGAPAAGRVLDTVEVPLGADGELVPVRFDVAGLASPGRRLVAVRVIPPAADQTPADDVQAVDVEVVDRVTQVLLMAGGPAREYQFLRNVLERDKSFAVDVLLGTATTGISQDARRILDAFPATDETLGDYDAVVAIDYDWRLLDPAAQARLERWVAGESGGLVLVAGGVFMDGWLGDPRTSTIRGLHPLDLRRRADEVAAAPSAERPRRLEFSRDGSEAECLRLADTRAASEAVWQEFPGVYSCSPSAGVKPGATVYARLVGSAAAAGPVYLAGQLYGTGSVLALGSGELWRLRALGDAVYERLVAQLVRHVAQGRLLRGARRGRLIVEQDRVAVGGTVRIRVVAAAVEPPPECHAVAPDGSHVVVPLTPEPARPGTFAGGFVAGREGGWTVEVEPLALGDERLSRRIQVQLPDRELENPRLDRGVLTRLATETGGTARFLADGASPRDLAEAIAAALPDRSRRDYETGAIDAAFKRRLNWTLLVVAAGCLSIEWGVRRIVRLA